MKNVYQILGAALGATLALAACSREATDPESPHANNGDGQVTLTINARQGANSKTYIDGTDVKWSFDTDSDGTVTSTEKLRVFEVTPDTIRRYVSAAGKTTDSGATMTFDVTLNEDNEASSFAYYAFYPSGAYYSGQSSPNKVESVVITVPSKQTPASGSFDPDADILIAEPQTGTSQATSLDMRFARVVAVGKMTITGLGSSDPVTAVTFSAKDASGQADTLAGRTAYNLATAEVVRKNTADASIILDYSSLGLAANESLDVWFTCLPFSLDGGGSFTVTVETGNQTFTKEVSLTSSQKLEFTAGKASRFTVDMSSATGKSKSYAGVYAELTYSDFNSVYTSGSYGDASVTKPDGDIWKLCAANQSSAIQIRNSSSTNDSYIKLPDFTGDISTVTVSLAKAIAAGKTLTLETSATGNKGSIASQSTEADKTEYVFDLTTLDSTYTTAYLRSNGALALVSKVAVIAGDDTRIALAAPASVTATVDAETANTINVTWDAVGDAASYTVTLYDGDVNVVKTVSGVTGTSYSFTDLAWSSDYMVTVKAVPSDYYTSKDSDEKDSAVVTTGAEPAGSAYYVKVTSAPEDWSGTYLIVSEKVGKALSSISSTKTKYGVGSDVTITSDKIQSTAATDAYKVVIAAATTTSGAYTLSLGTLGYLYWNSGNSLNVNSSDSANTNWTITAGSTQGNWVIANCGTSTRQIWYNTGSPRFACYTGKSESTSGYAPIQLYRLESGDN